jgi:hypothetical protein
MIYHSNANQSLVVGNDSTAIPLTHTQIERYRLLATIKICASVDAEVLNAALTNGYNLSLEKMYSHLDPDGNIQCEKKHFPYLVECLKKMEIIENTLAKLHKNNGKEVKNVTIITEHHR